MNKNKEEEVLLHLAAALDCSRRVQMLQEVWNQRGCPVRPSGRSKPQRAPIATTTTVYARGALAGPSTPSHTGFTELRTNDACCLDRDSVTIVVRTHFCVCCDLARLHAPMSIPSPGHSSAQA